MTVLQSGFGSSGSYEIDHSLRFRASASAYLSRTPGVAGNRKTWTWSGWVKRGALGGTYRLFSAPSTGGGDDNYFSFLFNSSDKLLCGTGLRNIFVSTPVYRDPSAHLHIVLRCDTTQATASSRMRLFVNGVEVTTFDSTSAVAQNTDMSINSNLYAHAIGALSNGGNPFDGYLSEVNFIDGQALTPNDFGETDPVTGVWVPKAYTGTYGTNGFYLPFNDGTNLTNLCLDRSGNGNNWTANNISLTAGATYDWMDDTPTNNFAVLNPLWRIGSNGTNSDALGYANLESTGGSTASSYVIRPSTIGAAAGKWYAEVQITAINATTSSGLGVCNKTFTNKVELVYLQGASSQIIKNGSVYQPSITPSMVVNDVVGIAVDYDAGTLQFYRNGSTYGSQVTGITADTYFFHAQAITSLLGASAWQNWNFGQRPFAYTPPTGFLPLCTKNIGTIAPISSGSFTGNANADGPFVWLAGTPDTMTINGNAVTWGTHADRLANGFKVRTSSASYNAAGTNTFSVSSFVDEFDDPNRAKGNP